MIDGAKEFGYTLTCDECEMEEGEVFDEFMEAVEYKKSNGWHSVRKNGEWNDVCPECWEKFHGGNE